MGPLWLAALCVTISANPVGWSNAMVAMYQARRTREIEDNAARAASEFSAFLRDYVEARRRTPGDDLLSQLIAAEEAGERLSTDELIATCVLLLNAGHEATVHTMGNGIRTLLETGHGITAETAAPAPPPRCAAQSAAALLRVQGCPRPGRPPRAAPAEET